MNTDTGQRQARCGKSEIREYPGSSVVKDFDQNVGASGTRGASAICGRGVQV
jgi:hypothetical protein